MLRLGHFAPREDAVGTHSVRDCVGSTADPVVLEKTAFVAVAGTQIPDREGRRLVNVPVTVSGLPK